MINLRKNREMWRSALVASVLFSVVLGGVACHGGASESPSSNGGSDAKMAADKIAEAEPLDRQGEFFPASFPWGQLRAKGRALISYRDRRGLFRNQRRLAIWIRLQLVCNNTARSLLALSQS